MCRRFTLQTSRSRIAAHYFDVQLPVGAMHARYMERIRPSARIRFSRFRFGHTGGKPRRLLAVGLARSLGNEDMQQAPGAGQA